MQTDVRYVAEQNFMLTQNSIRADRPLLPHLSYARVAGLVFQFRFMCTTDDSQGVLL